MFHKASTEAERQKLFDDYMLRILKEKEVIKKNKKIIDDQDFIFDPTIDEEKVKGAFNSYVDSLVVKNFLIEQIHTRLKINKNMAMQFVNKLDGNQVLILSKVINEFIKDIQDKYVSINDYILKRSFDELQGTYNVVQQQEKDNEIVRQNQVEQGEVLQENIPAEELEPQPAEREPAEVFADEQQKLISFLNKSIFKIKGRSRFTAISIKKILLSEYLTQTPNSFAMTSKINEKYITELLPMLNRGEDDKREARLSIQRGLKKIFFASPNIPDDIKQMNEKIFDDVIVGTGYGVNNDPYISVGKYLIHKQHLLGGKLQVRSQVNHNQIHGFKSQNVTNNIRDVLLKLHKNEPIGFKDIDKLSEIEKNQLHTIGKKLHITDLFDIPSTLKSQEDKLKDEFILLRGSLLAGNNNPDLLRKFKIVLLKMKNNKLISLQEYNEVLNILLEMEI